MEIGQDLYIADFQTGTIFKRKVLNIVDIHPWSNNPGEFFQYNFRDETIQAMSTQNINTYDVCDSLEKAQKKFEQHKESIVTDTVSKILKLQNKIVKTLKVSARISEEFYP